jgi:NitT/TauT family transport system permease protein
VTVLDRPVAGPIEDEAVAAAPARGRRSWRGVARAVLPPLGTLVVLVAIWELVSTEVISQHRRFLLPTPGTVVSKGLFDATTMSQIAHSMWLTTELVLVGLSVAVVLGILLGLLMYRFGWAERASYPYLVALQAVPVLAIAPLMTVMFGYGFGSKSIIVVIIAFFPIPTTLLLGMKSADKGMLDLFRLHGASWPTVIRKLSLPNAMPALFTGLKISAGLAVIGAIVGELFFQQGRPGLGQRLYAYQTNMQYPQLYTALIFSSLLGISIFTLFGWLGNRAVRSWHESADQDR